MYWLYHSKTISPFNTLSVISSNTQQTVQLRLADQTKVQYNLIVHQMVRQLQKYYIAYILFQEQVNVIHMRDRKQK